MPARGSVASDLDDAAVARERKARKRDENEVEFSRIVAFSDGVFSIAITLLVLNLHIERDLSEGELASALWDQRENLIAYAVSFAVVGRFWLVHHTFFSKVKAFDSRLIALNMFYLGWVVLVPFSSQVSGEYSGELPAVILYSGNLAGVVLIGQLMSWDALRAGLTTIDAETARESLGRASFIAGIFLLSILVALFDSSVAPFVWFLLFLEPNHGLFRRISGRGTS